MLAKILRLSLLWLCLLGTFSCKKNQASASSAHNSTSTQLALASAKSAANTPDFVLDLFDDDEKITIFPQAYIDARLQDYQSTQTDTSTSLAASTNTSNGTSSFNEAAFIDVQAINLDIMIAQALQAQDTTVSSQSLGLVNIPLGTAVALQAKKAIFIATDFLVHVGRTVLSRDLKYRQTYFEKAVNEKWENPEYVKFNVMKPIEIKDASLQNKLVGFKQSDLAQQGATVRLGMLPNKDILTQLTASSRQEVKIISIVQDFERDMLETKTDLKLSKEGPKSTPYERGRSKKEFPVEDNTYGVRTLNQYSTPDRTMMTEGLVQAAIKDVLASTSEGDKIVYVHCKSGKGRSASIVVGSRVAAIIEWAKENKRTLSTQDIDTLLKEQIDQVTEARNEIGISPTQINNLKLVLYNW